MNSYKENIQKFLILSGYIKTAMEFDSFKDVYNDYEYVLNVITKWTKEYYLNHNLNNINFDESLKLHTLIDNIREKKLFDKDIGNEKTISDDILIWYEILIKKINDGRDN